MPLRQPLQLAIPLAQVQQHYPSTWYLLVKRLHLCGSQLQQMYYETLTESEQRRYTAGATAGGNFGFDSSCSPEAALQLWLQGRTLGQLMQALAQCKLYEALALLLQNLMNVPAASLQEQLRSQWGLEQHHQKQQQQQQQQMSGHMRQFDYKQLEEAISLAKESVIGHGAFAVVHRVSFGSETVAVKKYRQEMYEVCKEAVSRSYHVISCLQEQQQQQQNRVNIAQLLGFCHDVEAKVLMTVFKYYPNGNLRQLIEDFEKNPNKVIGRCRFHLASVRLGMACELASAIAFLHSRSELTQVLDGSDAEFYYVHQDVKTVNVLLDENYHCYLGDLDYLELTSKGTGSTELIRSSSIKRIYTKGFQCAQDDAAVTCKSDVYSAAVTILEMITGVRGESLFEQQQQQQQQLRRIQPQAGLLLSHHCLEQLLTRALNPALLTDFRKRSSADELSNNLQEVQKLAENEEMAAATAATADEGKIVDWRLNDEYLVDGRVTDVNGRLAEICVIQIPNSQTDTGASKQRSDYVNQMEKLQRHPNVQQLLAVSYQLPDRIVLLLEQCQSLASSTVHSPLIPMNQRLPMFKQLASALQFLHLHRVTFERVGEQQQQRVLLSRNAEFRLSARLIFRSLLLGQGVDEVEISKDWRLDVYKLGMDIQEILNSDAAAAQVNPVSIDQLQRQVESLVVASSTPTPVSYDIHDRLVKSVVTPCLNHNELINAAFVFDQINAFFDSPTSAM